MYDVFVLLGTNQMNLNLIKSEIKEYQTFSQNSVKYDLFLVNLFYLSIKLEYLLI